jgi:hypothetical protein
MSTVKKPSKKDSKDMKDFMEKIRSEAASQDKYFDVYLAERSDGLRKMFIRWHKEGIKELEQIKSQAE